MRIFEIIKKYKWWFVSANCIALFFAGVWQFVWTSGSTMTGLTEYPFWMLGVFFLIGLIAAFFNKLDKIREVILVGIFTGIYFEIILILYLLFKTYIFLRAWELSFSVGILQFIPFTLEFSFLLMLLTGIGGIIGIQIRSIRKAR